MRIAVVAAYAALCLIWGTTWLAIKIGLHTLGPLMGVGLRFAIAGALLAVVAVIRGEVRPLRSYPWGVIVVLAATLFGFDYLLTYVAETHLDSGLVSVLFGTSPFFNFIIGYVMLREYAGPLVWVGALVAFAGVAIISLTGEVQASIPYALCAVAAGAVAAFANVYAKRYADYPPLVTLPPAMLLAGGVIAIVGLFAEPTNWGAVLTPASLGALLYLAIVGSGLAFFLLMWLLSRIPAYAVGLSTLIFPVVALAAGALLGGEHLGTRELLGSALVIGGLGFTLGKPSARS
jgi:drug/metabolite transporter (DMT)-like permease